MKDLFLRLFFDVPFSWRYSYQIPEFRFMQYLPFVLGRDKRSVWEGFE